LANAETSVLQFFDEGRKRGHEEQRKNFKVWIECACQREANQHRKRATESESDGRQNGGGKPEFAGDFTYPCATHQQNGEDTKDGTADLVDALHIVEGSGSMQLEISGNAGKELVGVRGD